MRHHPYWYLLLRVLVAVPLGIVCSVGAAPSSASAAPAVDGAGATAADPAPPSPRVELVLDLSGSMNENDAGGQTRLSAAKQAVTRIVDTAPQQAQLGLRVYGATYPGEDKKLGCADTQQVVPVGFMNDAARTEAKQRVSGFKALGFTPIGVSLRAAAQDVGKDGKRRVVLVSDGEDTCAPPPPCEVAKQLKSQGVDLAVDTVGFKTTGAARDQLKCIAEATGGSYADADNADTLSTNLNTLFRRAWTTYQATGTPVQGSTNGCADAPLITPGQYLDGFTGGRDLYYRVAKRPDQQLQVSATAVGENGYTRNSGIEVSAGPPPATSDEAPDDWLDQSQNSVGWANVITAGGRSGAGQGDVAAPGDVGCVKVTNDVTQPGEPRMPVELLVGIADAATAQAGERVPPPRTGADAAGGFSFNSATPVGPGTYHQSIAVGEAPFWRVEVKAGQQLTVTAGVDIPADFPGDTPTGWGVTIFDATRTPTTCSADDPSAVKLFSGETGHFERTCGPWPVTRPDGGQAPESGNYSTPGTYYIQAQVAEPSDKAKGVVVPISLTVGVTGTPLPGSDPVFSYAPVSGSDQPGADTPPPSGVTPGSAGPNSVNTGTTVSEGKRSTSDDWALPVGIGVGAALLVAATVLTWVRRHRGSRGGAPRG